MSPGHKGSACALDCTVAIFISRMWICVGMLPVSKGDVEKSTVQRVYEVIYGDR